jgi:hypothetical protein
MVFFSDLQQLNSSNHMAYLDTRTTPLTPSEAAHLLRRSTFGPTPSDIVSFTGLTPLQAVSRLISNKINIINPTPPIEFDENRQGAGETYLEKPFNGDRNLWFGIYVSFWWIGLMSRQDIPPCLLDKLTLFWQNHFVSTRTVVNEYRLMYKYLTLIRNNSLGNFRFLVTEITKDPAMLKYLNGNENVKTSPNENYARELQEIFTVGNKDFNGNNNYTEDDVKAAARVLTGWSYSINLNQGISGIESIFNENKHDNSAKQFSSNYDNRIIEGRSGPSAGQEELNELVDILLDHPQTPRNICRKLYRWYVNATIDQDIEDNVIGPLASLFSSPSNDFDILPVVEKLLTSEIFYHQINRGAIIKSPAELIIGTLRFFELSVPNMTTEYVAFRKYMDFIYWNSRDMQLYFLDQPSVFGYEAYYTTGYSKNWINSTILGQRNQFTDTLLWPTYEIKPGYKLFIDILARVRSLQPNFGDIANTPAIGCEVVVAGFINNLFAIELNQNQIDFLTDTIMMMGYNRNTWKFEWNAYRSDPNNTERQNTILWRTRALVRYLLRMAEYHLL